jgi:hypothetical protein
MMPDGAWPRLFQALTRDVPQPQNDATASAPLA